MVYGTSAGVGPSRAGVDWVQAIRKVATTALWSRLMDTSSNMVMWRAKRAS
jgi:hypothetical protein